MLQTSSQNDDMYDAKSIPRDIDNFIIWLSKIAY